ncbi:exported hypothetical protein [Mesorhizobium sp. SOD10]|nr:exported hypothetical protein [Mesorhizobium sp. SOD10]
MFWFALSSLPSIARRLASLSSGNPGASDTPEITSFTPQERFRLVQPFMIGYVRREEQMGSWSATESLQLERKRAKPALKWAERPIQSAAIPKGRSEDSYRAQSRMTAM